MALLRWIAAPLAPLYGALVRARNRAFDRHPERAARAGVPVLSVGNLSTGGTGKTPLTLHLAEALQARGWTNAVLSRGYGGRRPVDPMDVEPDTDPALSGDEPLLMARRLGPGRVVVGRKRLNAALRALASEPPPRLLLLDDGFQHRALHRDLDLLLLDGVRTWGNGRMLPLGDLREPMESARRAHALVVTRGSRADRAKVEDWWRRHGSGGPVFYVDFRIERLRAFDGSAFANSGGVGPLLAFCALGHPEAFFADLMVAGFPWIETAAFRDHQRVEARPLQALAEWARKLGAAGLVCTEKDAVKLRAVPADCPLWVAEQRVVGAEALVEWIAGSLGLIGEQQRAD